MNKRFRTMVSAVMTVALGCTLMTAGSFSKVAMAKDSKVNIEVFSNKPESKITLNGLIGAFEKQNPNIKVTLNVPPNAGTALKARLTKNDMPDVVLNGGDSTYSELASSGVLMDLSKEKYMSTILPSYMNMLYDLNSGEKKAYGVPYATNADGILYNKDAFKKLGLTIPKTWSQLMTVIKKIEAAKQVPFYLTLKDAWTGMCFWNVIASDLQPANFLKDRAAGKTTFKATHSVIADKVLELSKHGENDTFGLGYNDGNAAFAQGKSVMYLQGNWAISEIKKINPKANIGMFAIPATDNKAQNKITSGIDVLLSISNTTKHPQEAKKFLSFMMQKQNAQKYINEQFAFSAIKGVVQKDPSVMDAATYFNDDLINGFPDHFYPAGLDTASILQSFLKNHDKKAFLEKLDSEYDKAQKASN